MNRAWMGWSVVALGCACGVGCSSKESGSEAEDGGGASAAGSSSQSGSGGSDAGASSSGDAGMPAEGGSSPALDPCEGVTAQGECVTPNRARACVVPTGNGTPMLVTTTCREFEHCESGQGQARCVLNEDACVPGQSECVDDRALRVCDDSGTWKASDCSVSCRPSALGGFCVDQPTSGTFEGRLLYEAVGPYDDYSDWSDTSVALPAEGVLVLSGDGTDWVDAALVGEDGTFSVQVPGTSTGDEQLAFFLLHPDPTGSFAQLGVFEPNVPSGEVGTDEVADGQVWSWSAPLSDFTSGQTIQIAETQGSGAIHVYTRLRQVQQLVSEFYGEPPGKLAAWMRLNTAWDCGACFAPWGAEVSAMPFDSQLFISATAEDRAYWSDAVTIHESGHYAMWSYGVSPNEGGPHCLGQPTAPGQAWSEGWATGFSSILRGSPVYWDKQQGSMFWFDLEQRQYDSVRWQRPKPSAGLQQALDENEVAAMLYGLSTDPEVGGDVVLAGLTTPSVTEPDFKRGYTRHVWDMRECQRVGYYDTGETSPMFADYLDGLVCGGVPAAAVDRSTSPTQFYPYPSQSPICE